MCVWVCVCVCECVPTGVPYLLLKSCSDDACSFVLVCHCVRYVMHISPSIKLHSCIRLYLSAAEVTLPSYIIPLVHLWLYAFGFWNRKANSWLWLYFKIDFYMRHWMWNDARNCVSFLTIGIFIIYLMLAFFDFGTLTLQFCFCNTQWQCVTFADSGVTAATLRVTVTLQQHWQWHCIHQSLTSKESS